MSPPGMFTRWRFGLRFNPPRRERNPTGHRSGLTAPDAFSRPFAG
jgi:hypothetical protein